MLYPEERPDFVLPESYKNPETKLPSDVLEDVEKQEDSKELGPGPDAGARDIEEGSETTDRPPVQPQRSNDGHILVDWYSDDDPANPQNWSSLKKALVTLQICLYTFAVYAGSSIYVPGEELIMDRFGVQYFKASLGLALYVLAYGLGPLLWSPLSEMPLLGRNIPYIVTFFIFVILCIPTALVDNLGGLLVLRFLQGFFGSPCLASGGATMQDIYSLFLLPVFLAAWVSSAYCGPALGSLLSAFAVTAEDWRWALWEILWMAGPVFGVMFFFLPETSADNILLRRAKRLRKLTNNQVFFSQSEVKQRHLRFRDILVDSLIKPLEITIKDPAVLFTNVYTALIYGIYYSFFEVFPLVYPVIYGFSLGLTATVFVCIIVACILGVAVYYAYLFLYLFPDIMKRGLRAQEHRLIPALFSTFFTTAGLFIFAWTSRKSVHWIVSVIGLVIYGGSGFITMQCIFIYIPMSYPQYAASLFAANDAFRSMFAFGSILFSRAMYLNLGVAKGVTLLAGLSVLGIIGMFVLYLYGANLRRRSKFALHE